jgi:hypothetical protein
MAKEAGLAITTLSVDDSGGTVRDIRNDITSFEMSMPRGVQDVTGLDKSAMERLLLLADLSVDLKGVFNSAATTTSHAVFKTVTSTSVQRTMTAAFGSTLQTMAAEMIATNYQLSRSESGELTWTVPLALANGTTPTWA